MTKPETQTETPAEETANVSKKRQVAAVATATAATVVLTVAANVLIGQISAVISRRINPPKTEDENE